MADVKEIKKAMERSRLEVKIGSQETYVIPDAQIKTYLTDFDKLLQDIDKSADDYDKVWEKIRGEEEQIRGDYNAKQEENTRSIGLTKHDSIIKVVIKAVDDALQAMNAALQPFEIALEGTTTAFEAAQNAHKEAQRIYEEKKNSQKELEDDFKKIKGLKKSLDDEAAKTNEDEPFKIENIYFRLLDLDKNLKVIEQQLKYEAKDNWKMVFYEAGKVLADAKKTLIEKDNDRTKAAKARDDAKKTLEEAERTYMERILNKIHFELLKPPTP